MSSAFVPVTAFDDASSPPSALAVIASITDVAIAVIIEMNLLSFFIYFTPF